MHVVFILSVAKFIDFGYTKMYYIIWREPMKTHDFYYETKDYFYKTKDFWYKHSESPLKTSDFWYDSNLSGFQVFGNLI